MGRIVNSDQKTSVFASNVFLSYLSLVVSAIIIAIIGAVIAAAVWGIYYAITGSIPKIWGYSRFWLDVISCPFYLIFTVAFVVMAKDNSDYLFGDSGDWSDDTFSLHEFVQEYPFFSLFGALLVVDFVASFWYSFAAGLVGVVAISALYAIAYGIIKGISLFCEWCYLRYEKFVNVD